MTKKEIIEKPIIGYKEIMTYLGVSKKSAYTIIDICKIAHNGQSNYGKHKIKTESFMAFLGTTREKEIKILRAGSYEDLHKNNIF